MARMIVIYPTPTDVAAFDRHYFGTHVPLARKLPGLLSYEISDGPVVAPVGGQGIHRVGILTFADMEAIRTAFASPEGQAAAADRRLFAPDSSGYRMYLFDVRQA
jgi:uncharacterized protein (TIGR02118 family)